MVNLPDSSSYEITDRAKDECSDNTESDHPEESEKEVRSTSQQPNSTQIDSNTSASGESKYPSAQETLLVNRNKSNTSDKAKGIKLPPESMIDAM